MRSPAKEVPLNERDRKAADDWMRGHLPDPGGHSLEDNEEQGDTQKYFFLRFRDSATVVYKVAVKDGDRHLSQIGGLPWRKPPSRTRRATLGSSSRKWVLKQPLSSSLAFFALGHE